MFSGGKVEKIPAKLKSSAKSLTSGNKMVVGVLVGLALCWFLGNNIDGFENHSEGEIGTEDCVHSCDPPSPDECDKLIKDGDITIANFLQQYNDFTESGPGSPMRSEHRQCNESSGINQKQVYCLTHALEGNNMPGATEAKIFYEKHIADIYGNSCARRRGGQIRTGEIIQQDGNAVASVTKPDTVNINLPDLGG